MTPPLAFATEAAEAIAARRPLVALESTIITHGMPFPANLETARAVEAEVRAAGATPATIAIRAGRIHIGLEPAELDALAAATDVRKLSRADLAVALAAGLDRRHHRRRHHDLRPPRRHRGLRHRRHRRRPPRRRDELRHLRRPRELARTPVTVVASGAKAILDLPKTLEVLETLGVPVIAYGQDALPAFWSRSSGLPAPLRLDDPAAIARAHRMRARLGLPGGQLVANPIPPEAEIPAAAMAPHIAAALAAAEAQGIAAKEVTPFLLSRIGEATAGAALAANIALVLNNARLAARIATELATLPA